MDRNSFEQYGLEISACPLAQACAEKCQAGTNHGAHYENKFLCETSDVIVYILPF